jgi:hypothetical protein
MAADAILVELYGRQLALGIPFEGVVQRYTVRALLQSLKNPQICVFREKNPLSWQLGCFRNKTKNFELKFNLLRFIFGLFRKTKNVLFRYFQPISKQKPKKT